MVFAPMKAGLKVSETVSVRVAPTAVTEDAERSTEHWLLRREPGAPGTPESIQVGALRAQVDHASGLIIVQITCVRSIQTGANEEFGEADVRSCYGIGNREGEDIAITTCHSPDSTNRSPGETARRERRWKVRDR